MAFANSKFISLLLIVTLSGLMMISAEEEVVEEMVSSADGTIGERQSKQLFYVQPQLTPASSYPLKYFSNSPYDLMMPKQTPLIRRFQQQFGAYNYPLLSSPELKADREEEEDEETPAGLRQMLGHVGYGDLNGMSWWRRGLNADATIIIKPPDSDCLNANLATEGFGPCKRASQANHGTIDITLGVAAQSAVIAITSHSPSHTRVKLICTAITNADIFTQSGKIALVTDTPRTEVGYMHLVVTSNAAAAIVKCFWLTYRHYTATYP